ncbi:MAG: hypothetical protein PHQ75_09920 [Thermoguttaceae bacterium]|nr:hypothetical protein [Thermoguttaceae bacterium]
MKKTLIGLVVVVVAAVVIGFFVSPAFRTKVISKAEKIGQWTPEAIQKDPIGYSEFVESRLKKDLEEFKTTRKNLGARMDDIAKKMSDKGKLLVAGRTLADEIAEAIEAKKYPVTVAGKEYTESQLRSQLSLVVAQMDTMTESLSELEKIQMASEKENERAIIQMEKTESQLSLVAARREIFKAKARTAEGLEMITQCNAVLEQNQTVFANNPVRTIEEMLADTEAKASGAHSASAERVEKYLDEYRAKKGGKANSTVQTQNIPSEPAKAQGTKQELTTPKQEQKKADAKQEQK